MLINSVILKICLRKLDAKPNGSSTSSRSQTTLAKRDIQCEELHKGCVSQSNSKCILLNYNWNIIRSSSTPDAEITDKTPFRCTKKICGNISVI